MSVMRELRWRRFVTWVAAMSGVLMLSGVQPVRAQPPYYLSVHTSTQTDTLVQGVLNWLSFTVDSGGSEPLAAVTWPISLSFSGGNLIGPLYDTGGYPNVGYVPWPGGLDSTSLEQANPAGANDTVSVGLWSAHRPWWQGTGEQWRMSFVPTDTGQIVIDTATAVSALDSNGTSYPIVWEPRTVTVVPYCPTGDLNADGQLDGRDLFILVRYVLYTGPPPDVCLAHADVNCDGVITSADIIHEIHYIFHGDKPLGYTCSAEMQALWGCQ